MLWGRALRLGMAAGLGYAVTVYAVGLLEGSVFMAQPFLRCLATGATAKLAADAVYFLLSPPYRLRLLDYLADDLFTFFRFLLPLAIAQAYAWAYGYVPPRYLWLWTGPGPALAVYLVNRWLVERAQASRRRLGGVPFVGRAHRTPGDADRSGR